MKKLSLIIIALIAFAQTAWAQTNVSTESELTTALSGESPISVKLMANIPLSEKLTISSDKTVTLDLNGKKLSRSLTANENYGMVIYNNGGNLTINDGSGDNSGSIEGGRSYNGAGVLCESGSTLTVNGGTFRNNDVSRHDGSHGRGGAIFMNPNTTLTVTGGVFDSNSAYNGGAIYIDDGGPDNGTPASATISGAEFTNCWVTGDGGAIYNAGSLTITGGTIQNNTAELYGGGLFSYSNISMSGNPVVTGNKVSGSTNNVYLYESAMINCGTFTSDATIGIDLDKAWSYYNRSFTLGFGSNNSDAQPGDYFTADVEGASLVLMNHEVWLSSNGGTFYVECSWEGGNTDGHVVKTMKLATGVDDYTNTEDLYSGWYLLKHNHEYSTRPRCHGDVNFILADGCDAEFKKGIHIDKDKTLTIYCQSYGDNMGKLRATGDGGSYLNGDAAIGGNNEVVGGHLIVHGGDIYAKPEHDYAAGIGGGDGDSGMQSVTIYGGKVEASCEENAAGIGSSEGNNVWTTVTIYGGEVSAYSGRYGAGIGGGENRGNGEIKIYGGSVTATSGGEGAGIGGGEGGSLDYPVYIYGGTVTAKGGQEAAGIGGGCYYCGGAKMNANVIVYGGTVTATGGTKAAGIGNGSGSGNHSGSGGSFIVYGGTVKATGGEYGAGIGGGHNSGGIFTYIYGGNVEAKGGEEGAGIGGGRGGDGGYTYLYGGTVKAWSARPDTHLHYIGRGSDDGYMGRGGDHQRYQPINKTLELGETMMVSQNGSRVGKDSRKSTCESNPGTSSNYVIIEPCDHSGGVTYTDKNDYYHHVNCKGDYCEGYDEAHIKGSDSTCTVCGHKLPKYAFVFYEANEAGTGYDSIVSYYVQIDNQFTFPSCSNVPDKMVFAGWKQPESTPTSPTVDDDTGLIKADSTITVGAISGDQNYYACYKKVYFSGGDGTISNPFLIADEEDWDELATAVSNDHDFSGFYFSMTNDIGTTENPVITMVGSNQKKFRGTFDGQGHTLTVNITSSAQNTAPFHYIKGATIKNLKTAGTITTSQKYAGGIVGNAVDAENTITNCMSSVTISSSVGDDGTHGGLVAHVSSSTTTISGCVFNGKLLGSSTTNCGGIVGWVVNGATLNIEDCLFAPSEVTFGTSNSATFYRQGTTATVNMSNCYYAQAFGDTQGTQAYTVQSGTDNLTLDYGNATTSYSYNGIKVYSFDQDSRETATGLLYNDTLYTGGTTKVTFTPDAPKGYIATNVQANVGTLTANSDDSYTLTMDSTNVSITADFTATITRIVEAADDWSSASKGWVFISSPLAASIAPSSVSGLVADTASHYDLYRLNPSNTMWENYKNTTEHSDFKLVNGQGYLYASKYRTKLVFVGPFNNGSSMTVDLEEGWNLVGNPFTESVAINKSYYKMNNTGSGIEAVDITQNTDSIAVCTGIVVEATGNNETITFSRKTSSKSSGSSNNGGLSVTLSQVVELVPEPVEGREGLVNKGDGSKGVGPSTGSGVLAIDNAIVSFNEGSQLGKFYFGKQDAYIYIPQNGKDYAIAFSEGQSEMPLNFKAKENGTYTLNFSTGGIAFSYLHLIDNLTGADVDLLTPPAFGHPLSEGDDQPTPSYTFTAKTTDYESRFRLVFAAKGQDGPSTGSGTFAFIDANGNIIITDEDACNASLQVVDVMGRVIRCRDAVPASIPTTGMTPGIYILRLINGDNVRTQKIVVK